jgi:hypothetical protein
MLEKSYWKGAHLVNLDDIENLYDRAVMAREVATYFFSGTVTFGNRLDINHRTLWNYRYNHEPLSEGLAWRVDSWNEGISFAFLRPDLVSTEHDEILGNNIPVRCQNCAYRFGQTLVAE